jgi:hypothetical protein
MKKILILFAVIITGSCTSKITTTEINFDWLLGHWVRTNEVSGKSTFENWVKLSDKIYIGHSFTIKNLDTIWQENVRLTKTDSVWSYDVTPKGDSIVTSFKVIQLGEKGFTCENELNEFPKKILYRRENNVLYAEISAGETKIPFEFRIK